MAFKNRIRLPFKITRAQFPEERTSFRKANGEVKTLSVVVRKQYEGETDYLPEKWHERLKIALAHDNIRVEGEKYLGDISQDGEYNIEWPDFLDYPTGKAAFKVQVTPFAETNSNCMSCEEATQLSLVDDTITGIYGALQEGQTYEWPLADNDNICCYPAVFSVIWFNTDYLSAYSIDSATGVISVTLGTDLVSVNGLKIATYRVTCPNGGYDEADVYADIEGVVEGCLAPTNIVVSNITPSSIQFSWTEPFPDATYYYEIYEGTGPIGSPVQSALLDIQTTVTISGLTPGTDYYFRIRTVCYGAESNYLTTQTATIPNTEACGEYNVAFDGGVPGEYRQVTYRDCSYDFQSTIVYTGSSVTICAAQTAPGTPVYLSVTPGSGTITTTYNGLC